MKSKSIIALTFVFALALAAIFLPVAGLTVQASDRCQAFHMFVQGTLPTPNRCAYQ